MIRYKELVLTTGADGAGTVTDGPINGEIIEVFSEGTAWSATADFTLTRAAFGGTILALTDAQEPFDYYPRVALVSSATAAITDSSGRIPCDGNVTLVVAGAGSVVPGTVTVVYDTLVNG
ncbi:MAG: hypothetical protein M0R37_07655 [Bacteroidales bacterium]|nr:hypothetical protein [Bacteroidales bacterium]